MTKMVLGIFATEEEASSALSKLAQLGYSPKDISLIMKRRDDHVIEGGSKAGEGMVSGAATGGIIGALAGLAIGVGALAIPGIGAFLIGGPIAAALGLTGAAATTATGAMTGAVAGGILGGLVGLGVPEEDARLYEKSINEGGILVVVPAQLGEEEQAMDVLINYGADQVKVITTAENAPRESLDETESRPAYFSEVRKSRRK